MNVDFEGRKVVVTGGTGALGHAVVRLLLESNASCLVPCRSGPAGPRAPEASYFEGVDLTEERQVEEFYELIPGLWASIHCVGGFAMSPFLETSLDELQGQLRTNLVTCFLCSREAVRQIRLNGGEGRLVNVSARPAVEPREGGGMVAYTASKSAVAALSVSLGEELAGSRIWVNAVVPSIMDTPANRQAMPEASHERWARVEEVAATVVFLASPQNRSTRSSVVSVYGAS